MIAFLLGFGIVLLLILTPFVLPRISAIKTFNAGLFAFPLVLVALIILGYLVSGQYPTQWPVWSWIFVVVLAYILMRGDTFASYAKAVIVSGLLLYGGLSFFGLQGMVNWVKSNPPATSVAELEDRIPYIKGNRIPLASGERKTVRVDHVVYVESLPCHYLNVLQDKDFSVTWPEDLSRFYIEPKKEGLHRLTVTLKYDPSGC